ncbi:hypothetical protein H5410_028609 [Solanum commersonii]|uniref:Uncharacterized protein n=1 Tax=Solanum commersonii TaxID=4109 RepID=A0A9J5Z4H4_SOLCO|nr:hypothetical protein H5410_028609 [Solanum commersonii]
MTNARTESTMISAKTDNHRSQESRYYNHKIPKQPNFITNAQSVIVEQFNARKSIVIVAQLP